ncbi:MAG: hypothetical protein J7K96_14005 [Desulfobacteraceae bacterium]|nr:hypothetical protein [Desulfobacteraceae bacterium]
MKTLFLIIMNLLVASQVFAGDATTIILNDGSVLNGEILSINSGSYSIQTESMGLININKSKISTINFGKPSDSERTSGNANSVIIEKASDLSKTIMDDEEIMKIIMGLQNNSDFKAVLNDPDIMNSINTGNIEALLSNPKFLKIMNNSDVKIINRKLSD